MAVSRDYLKGEGIPPARRTARRAEVVPQPVDNAPVLAALGEIRDRLDAIGKRETPAPVVRVHPTPVNVPTPQVTVRPVVQAAPAVLNAEAVAAMAKASGDAVERPVGRLEGGLRKVQEAIGEGLSKLASRFKRAGQEPSESLYVTLVGTDGKPYMTQMNVWAPGGGSSGGGAATDVSALATEATMQLVLTQLQRLETEGGTTVSGSAQAVSLMESYTEMIDTTTSGLTIYQAWGRPGTATAAALWRILRTDTVGSETRRWFADGDRNFDNVYDNRASLTYSP